MDQWACHPASRPGLGAVLGPRIEQGDAEFLGIGVQGGEERAPGERGPKGVPAPLHDHIDGRIELSLDVGGSVKEAGGATPGSSA
jgi:hypothetical protein